MNTALSQAIAILKDESLDDYFPFTKEQTDALLAVIRREQRAVAERRCYQDLGESFNPRNQRA